ncbi:unnamed protein product [Gemmata massiliana]|uniref:Uncharacterized protein n=1 Tax=Gemmata massiliana TaxID=1210884 RepID=A0A6P2DNA6_9BACT|nr:hypothetical protein [Gemmata massiliana]VTS03521.1 unnamed protein product [Gemmata massiliana]
MAVLSCELLFTGRGGQDTLDKHRTYTSRYEVITDDPHDGVQVVGNAPGLPGLGASYPTDAVAVVVSLEPEQSDDSPYLWYVTVSYDSRPEMAQSVNPVDGSTLTPGDPASFPENPLLRPAQWRITGQDSNEVVNEWRPVDANGEILTPAVAPWAANTVYTPGEIASNGGNVYVMTGAGVCVSAGSGGGPAGTGIGIADTPTAWAAFSAVALGAYRLKDAKVYKCTKAGTCGANGPSGNNTTGILDGSAEWGWVGAAAAWGYYKGLADYLGRPEDRAYEGVASSGGFPFDPPVMTEVSKPVLQVTVPLPSISLEYLVTMYNAVNAITWRGIPPRCAEVISLETANKYENGVAFVEATYTIALNKDTWDKRILDAAYGRFWYAEDPFTGSVFLKGEPFKDESGQAFTQPQLLDGHGALLPGGKPPVFLRGVPRQTNIVDFNTLLPF